MGRDIGDANMDESFLFPETPDSPCLVDKNACKLSKDEANEYMKWIQSRIPNVDKKDERVYCPYCDMKNRPYWSCHRFYKHQQPSEELSCTLCIGDHPALLCPRALVNNGIGDTQLSTQRMQIRERRQESSRSSMASSRHSTATSTTSSTSSSGNGDFSSTRSA